MDKHTGQNQYAPSTSLNFFDKVLLNDILKAAVWNNSSTFAKFYLGDMSQRVTNLHQLGPVILAKRAMGVWVGGGGRGGAGKSGL